MVEMEIDMNVVRRILEIAARKNELSAEMRTLQSHWKVAYDEEDWDEVERIDEDIAPLATEWAKLEGENKKLWLDIPDMSVTEWEALTAPLKETVA